MDYKPYSQEWHRYRYLREALEKYINDDVDNQVILDDILNIVCARQLTAHREFKKLSNLEAKLRD